MTTGGLRTGSMTQLLGLIMETFISLSKTKYRWDNPGLSRFTSRLIPLS